MAPVLSFLSMAFQQNIGHQILARTPEPEHQVVTEQDDAVNQYDHVMTTKLAINYAVVTEAIYRARQNPFGGKGLDIACGPGHLALNIAQDLKLDHLLGVDLSEPMVATASKNAAERKMGDANFEQADATDLKGIQDGSFDLCTMMDAVHHLPSLKHVGQSLSEMDRVTKPDGLIVVMDLVRLRTAKLTESYVNLLGDDYKQRGLSSFFEQFRDSMYAAWTPEELESTVPPDSQRNWVLVVPRGIPFAQFLFGLPASQEQVFVRGGAPWVHPPVRPEELQEYKLAVTGLRWSAKKRLG